MVHRNSDLLPSDATAKSTKDWTETVSIIVAPRTG
jgi:hypothetical protein